MSTACLVENMVANKILVHISFQVTGLCKTLPPHRIIVPDWAFNQVSYSMSVQVHQHLGVFFNTVFG